MANLLEIIRHPMHSLEEMLAKPFYSPVETELEAMKDSTQMTREKDLERGYVAYDPFSVTANVDLLGAITANGNYIERLKKWRDVAMLPEVDEALQEIVNEAIVYDDIEEVIKLNLDGIDLPDKFRKAMEDSFQHILYLLDFNQKGDELFRQWYVDAKLALEVVYDNKNMGAGIQKLVLLAPHYITKVKNVQTGEYKWVVKNKPTYNPVKDLEDPEQTFYDEQISYIDSGIHSSDKKFPISHLNKALKVINQLYLIEDSVIIYRITRAPEKRIFYVDTGNLPKTKAEEYIKSLILKYRQKKIYNFETGQVENKAKTASILEDFWFPVNAAGRGTKVDTLAAMGNDLSSIPDIDYFVNKLYKSLNIPITRRNPEGRVVITNGMDVEKDEIKFFKFILKLRRRFNNLLVDLLKKDLLAKGVFTLEDWKQIQEKIKFIYADDNSYSEIKQLQILNMRTEAAQGQFGLVEQGMMSKIRIQKEVFKRTDEEIKEIHNEWLIENPQPVETSQADVEDMKEALMEEFKGAVNQLINTLDIDNLAKLVAEKITVPQETQTIPKDSVIINRSMLESMREGDVIEGKTERIKMQDGRIIFEKTGK